MTQTNDITSAVYMMQDMLSFCCKLTVILLIVTHIVTEQYWLVKMHLIANTLDSQFCYRFKRTLYHDSRRGEGG